LGAAISERKPRKKSWRRQKRVKAIAKFEAEEAVGEEDAGVHEDPAEDGYDSDWDPAVRIKDEADDDDADEVEDDDNDVDDDDAAKDEASEKFKGAISSFSTKGFMYICFCKYKRLTPRRQLTPS
jgi:hypothetical protein